MLNHGLNGFTEKTIPYLSLVGGKGRTFGVGGSHGVLGELREGQSPP